jgi:hypothetical protein
MAVTKEKNNRRDNLYLEVRTSGEENKLSL